MLCMVLYGFWDRTVKIDDDRVVPFHRFGFWFPLMIGVIALNASSFRALDNVDEFFGDVIKASNWKPELPFYVETSNGFEAAQYSHYFVIVGVACLWFFYVVSFGLQWELVKEYKDKEQKEPNQLFAGWIIPLALSVISLLYGCVTVYYDVHFMVGDVKLDIPVGLRDIFIAGPIFTALIILYASMVSACRAHVLTPISRKTVTSIGFLMMFGSIFYVLVFLHVTDDLANKKGAANSPTRVHYDNFMQLLVVYILSFTSLLLVIVEDSAEAVPPYIFSKPTAEMIVYKSPKSNEQLDAEDEHLDEDHADVEA